MRLDKLDLNLLVVFDALLAHESVTRAADHLNLTQPTISSALSRLRTHFDDELLTPVGRRMVPTPLAHRLRQPVADLLRQARGIALTRAGFDPATSHVTLRVATSDYVATVLLADLAREVSETSPGIVLQINLFNGASFTQFAEGRLDAMVVAAAKPEAGEADHILFTDRFVPVVWSGLSVANLLSREQFEAMPHAVVEFGETANNSISDMYFDELAYRRSICRRLPNFAMLTEFIVGTPYLICLPSLLAKRLSAERPLRILQPDFAFPEVTEILRWPRHLETDPCNRWLRDKILGYAREIAPT